MNQFLQKYGGWMLAVLSSIGVVVRSGLAAHEAPRANDALARARDEKGEDLTFFEKAKVAGPIYAPSLISGGLTIGTIFGNQAMNSRQQTALMMAGATGTMLATEYDKYRRAIRAEQGDAVDLRALQRAKMTEEELRKEIERLKKENGPFLYSISTLPELIFEARPADIQEAFLHFNRNLILRGYNDLEELYKFIGIPDDLYDHEQVSQYGWNEYYNQIQWDCAYCDFDIEDVMTGNDTVVKVIDMPVPPYYLEADYENESVDNYVFHWYSPEQTKRYITELPQIWWDKVISIDHPYIYRTGLI